MTTQIKPEEQRHVESKPGGGYAKAHALRSLNLGPSEVERLREAITTDPTARIHRDEHERLFASPGPATG